MKHAILLLLVIAFFLQPLMAQELGEDVDDLKLTTLSPTKVRLSWAPFEPTDPEMTVSYSVFRGTSENFTPSLRNRVASGLQKTAYVVTEPAAKKDYYYYVKAVAISTHDSMGSPSPTEFPTEDQISLLLTQSERASEAYERAVKTESLVLPKQGADADAQVATQLRQIIAKLKGAPHFFSSPYGFMLIADLDDASRNMAVCMGQGWALALSSATEAELAMAQQKMLLSQSCLDTSTLLFTVSETAVEMYSNYLLADYQLKQRAANALNRCTAVMTKVNSKQSKIPTFAEWQKQQGSAR
jgi:hypothetical protein